MSQNTGLLIFLIIVAVIFVIALLVAIIGVSRRNKMGRPVTHATYGNNLDNANLDGSNGTDPRQQDGMNKPTGTGTNKSGNIPGGNRP